MGICPKCGLPEELCTCKEIKTSECINVYSEKRKFGKIVTMVRGVDKENVERVTLFLKRALGCGGVVRRDDNGSEVIELQGNHKSRIVDILVKAGFSKDIIKVT